MFYSVTGDGLTLLEMAVIQGNQPLLRLLQTHGATENQHRTYNAISLFFIFMLYFLPSS